MLTLKDFFVYYPPLNSSQFETKIAAKEEFRNMDGAGPYFPYQVVVSRFLNANTPYTGLLVAHEMGTGKTCTAVLAIENMRAKFRGALILAPNDKLLANFQHELIFKCTDGRYIPANFDSLTPGERTRRINTSTAFYKFDTFEKFAQQLSRQSDSDIRTQYDRFVWVFDEAHQITSTKFSVQYPQFLRALRICVNSKVLLLTGTPMVDDVSEIAPLMNLILPADRQLTGDFATNYLTPDGRANFRLQQALRGRVSYLRAPLHGIPRRLMGTLVGHLRHIQVTVDVMSEFQAQHYLAIYSADAARQNFFVHARAADLGVFPDGTCDQRAAPRYIEVTTRTIMREGTQHVVPRYRLTVAATRTLTTREDLARVSSKYAALFDSLDAAHANHRNTFVYSSVVHSTGLHYLIALLTHFGWAHATGDERGRAKRFIFLDPALTRGELQHLIAAFNAPRNRHGEYFAAIIGSEAIATGFSFMNVQQVEILTPHWNFKKVLQAIARGARTNSQQGLVNPVYDIYLRVSLASADAYDTSVSLHMYELAEEKDIRINHLERDLTINSFDCTTNYDQNYTPGFDNRPECQYLPCEYRCRGEAQPLVDYSTYNLLYAAPVITQLVNQITSLFETQAVYLTFFELIELTRPLTHFALLSALAHVINSMVIFRGRFILQELRNMYFLRPITQRHAHYYDTWLVDNNIIYTEQSNSVTIISAHATRNVMRAFVQAQTLADAHRLLMILPRDIQAVVFEELWRHGGASLAWQVVRDYFANFCDPRANIHWIHTPTIRQLADDWVDAHGPIAEHYLTQLQAEQTRLETNPYGYYGQFTKATDDFCIRSVEVTPDRQRRTSGKRCSNWDRSQLIHMITNVFRMVHDPATLDQIPTDNLCGMIRTWLTTANLIEENPSCGVQGKAKPRAIRAAT